MRTHIQGVYCKYRFYLDNEDTKTVSVSNTSNPNFDFSKHFSINPVTQQFLEYLTLQPLIIEVWGQQVETHNANKPAATHLLTTKELMNKETAKFGSVVILNPDPQKVCRCVCVCVCVCMCVLKQVWVLVPFCVFLPLFISPVSGYISAVHPWQ